MTATKNKISPQETDKDNCSVTYTVASEESSSLHLHDELVHKDEEHMIGKPIENNKSHSDIGDLNGKQKGEAENSEAIRNKRSPLENLSQVYLNDRATLLLIGDSVSKGLNPRRLAPPPEFMQKVCISGLTTLDFCRWLGYQSPCPDIKIVIVHLGINDCSGGPISTQDWREIMTLCEYVFPKAICAFSSIIPARGSAQHKRSSHPN